MLFEYFVDDGYGTGTEVEMVGQQDEMIDHGPEEFLKQLGRTILLGIGEGGLEA